MSRARLVLLSLVAALSAVGVMASSASAKISFEWLVGGKLLAAGETRGFVASADGKDIILTGTVGATKVELLSTELEVEKGAKIIGGKPGTNEEIVIFKGVKVVKPLNEGKEVCEVETPKQATGTVKTVLLKTEIVENQENGEPLILFVPKEGKIFTEITFLQKVGAEKCVPAGTTAQVTGSVLALPLPELGDVLTGDLDFEAKSKEFLLSPGGGTIEKAGLTFAGNAATFTALALILLETHELFGIF